MTTGTASPDAAAPSVGSARPTVVDLAYGRPLLFDPGVGIRRSELDVRSLLENADAMTVVRAGRRHHLRQAWQQVFAELLGPPLERPDRPLIVGHPSTWGMRRASALGSVGGGGPVTLVPRAVLIARSHADITVGRCAVVETTHIPRIPSDPAHPPRREWDVQILDRTPTGWAIVRSTVLDADAGATRGAGAAAVEAVVDDTVEAVFVDGEDPGDIDEAISTITSHAVAGRVVRVDRNLLVRLGRRTGGPADDAVPSPREVARRPVEPAAHTSRRPLVLGAVAALVVVAAALGIGLWQGLFSSEDAAPPAMAAAQLGRAELSVPGHWRQTTQDAPSDATGDPDTARAVFVSTDDGGRIIAVVTDLRPGSTRESVARSLRNRIEQRGDSVVTEFSAATRFGGREVVSYRESPASGSAIRWYVVVEDDLQVSIGCQSGSTGEPVDAACTQAVRSVRVR